MNPEFGRVAVRLEGLHAGGQEVAGNTDDGDGDVAVEDRGFFARALSDLLQREDDSAEDVEQSGKHADASQIRRRDADYAGKTNQAVVANADQCKKCTDQKARPPRIGGHEFQHWTIPSLCAIAQVELAVETAVKQVPSEHFAQLGATGKRSLCMYRAHSQWKLFIAGFCQAGRILRKSA